MSKQIAIRLASIPAVLAATAGTALAALPDGVTTETTTYKTDALAALGLILAAGVAIWGLKKLGSKLGWL
ncbi:major capsid protein [Mycobacterium tuberculosis]|uniref:major capsid protein n=1 Tax=Mycobacterium tuberculosis TaxID=1773 RepID=UPI0011579ACE|nr:major capsid protein [Mycobacterium tuberculosis]